MYTTKAINQNYDIEIPKCMYQVKSIHETVDIPDSDKFITSQNTTCNFKELNEKILNLINSPIKGDGINTLQDRQQKLLLQLNEFKNQLQKIRENLNIPSSTLKKSLNSKLMTCAEIESTICSENIVVNAHPKYIPYGLLGLKKLWQNNFNLSVNCYTHSTLSGEIGAAAEHFQKQIKINDDNKNVLPTISLTVIWKNCEHTEMICSKTMFKPIYGEVNVLRYLSRVGPKQFCYDYQINANYTDAILDICYQLVRCSGGVNQELLKILSEKLNKQSYFGGNQISIADVALSSSIKRCSQISAKNLPDNLKNWLSNANKILL